MPSRIVDLVGTTARIRSNEVSLIVTVRLSVIVVAFNAEKTIAATISALVAQQFQHAFEIVVVDDGSTDRTSSVIAEFGPNLIRHIRLVENVGRADARNIAVAASSGGVIVVADADDVSLKTRLDFHWRALQSGHYNVSGGQVVDLVDGAVKAGSTLVFPSDEAGVNEVFASGQMGIAHPASAFSRSWFESTGGYDPSLRWCEDYDLFARGWVAGGYIAADQKVLAYRRNESQPSWSYWWENQRHVRAINARISREGRGDIKGKSDIVSYLNSASAPRYKAIELFRFIIYRVVGDVRRSSRHSVGAQGK
jgi:glycosyltransferase involved in cell wall biosynthesis